MTTTWLQYARAKAVDACGVMIQVAAPMSVETGDMLGTVPDRFQEALTDDDETFIRELHSHRVGHYVSEVSLIFVIVSCCSLLGRFFRT